MLFRFRDDFFKKPAPSTPELRKASIAKRIYSDKTNPHYFSNWQSADTTLDTKELFNSFLKTEHFQYLKFELRILFDYLNNWCKAHEIDVFDYKKNKKYNIWDKFFEKVTSIKTELSSISSDTKIALFNDGKVAIEGIVDNLQNSTSTPLAKQIRLMKNFIADKRLVYCLAGAYNGFLNFHMNLPSKDWDEQAANIRHDIIIQQALIMVTREFDYFEGDEIHLARALVNHVADMYGVKTIIDPYIPQELPVKNKELTLAKFSEMVHNNITIEFIEKISQIICEELQNINTTANAKAYINKMNKIYLDDNFLLNNIYEFPKENDGDFDTIRAKLSYDKLFRYIMYSMIYRLYHNSSLKHNSLCIFNIEGSKIYFIPDEIEWSFIESTEFNSIYYKPRESLSEFLTQYKVLAFYNLVNREIIYTECSNLLVKFIDYISKRINNESDLLKIISTVEEKNYYAHGIFAAKLLTLGNTREVLNKYLEYTKSYINLALQIAVRYRSKSVNLLLLAGANPYKQSYYDPQFQNSAIHIAVINNDTDMLYKLVPGDLEQLQLNKNAWSPIYLAAKLGHWDLYLHLIYKTPNKILLKSEMSKILILAAKDNKTDIAIGLLSLDLNINLIYKKTPFIGYSALNFAICNSNTKLVRELLSYSILTNAKTYQEKKIKHIKLSIPSLLTAVNTPNIDEKIIQSLLLHGARLDITDNNGFTPAEILARQNSWILLKTLIRNSKYLDHDDAAQFSSCINYAVIANRLDIVTILIKEAKASPNRTCLSRNNRYFYPLHLAIKCNYLNIAEALLKLGAKPNHKFDTDSESAMILAVKSNNLDAVKLLLEFCYDIKSRELNNDTAIKIAALDKKWDIVKALAKGENDAVDSADFSSALIEACRNQRPDVVSDLLPGLKSQSVYWPQEMLDKISNFFNPPHTYWYLCEKAQQAINVGITYTKDKQSFSSLSLANYMRVC